MTSKEERELDDIAKIIYEKSGLYVQKKDYRKLRKFIEENFKSAKEVADILKYNSRRAQDLLFEIFDVLTVNETYFFRHPQQIDVLKDQILPELLEKKNRVRLWSAGCSTGEEPYTLAIVILELRKKLNKNFQAEIIANDISKKVLEVAIKGEYSDYAIRHMPKGFLDKYFIKSSSGKYKVKDEVKRLVRFYHMSLLDELAVKRLRNNMDVIFCRNVLIYFDLESKKKALGLLVDSLNVGGYLFLSPSESPRGLISGLRMILFKGAIAYRKEG